MSESAPLADAASPRPPRAKRWLIAAAKLLLIAIVIVAIQQSLVRAWRDLEEHRLQLAPAWFVLAGLLYVLGLLLAAWYFFWLLRSLDQPVRLFESIRAHYVGHMGKYVPGKGLVLVIRLGLLPFERRSLAAGGVAVFYETIMMMAVGAILAAVILPVWYGVAGLPALVAGLSAIALAIGTLPPILGPLGRLVLTVKPNWTVGHSLAFIGYRQFAMGWVVNIVVWSFLGLSFWATLRALLPAEQAPLSGFPFYVAASALAMVAGFASLLPGGAFVREAVLIELLDPRYGAGTAVVAAIALRCVWLLSEVVISAILYPLGLRVWSRATTPLGGD